MNQGKDRLMKKITPLTIFLTFIFCAFCFAQSDSGIFWIKTFQPGSSSLNDPNIDQQALAALDELMKDATIEVVFLGTADSLAWKMNGRNVHSDISDAWNDAKRLGRARALRARYGRGDVGITHENIAGVKVIWSRKTDENKYTNQIDELGNEIAELKNDLKQIHQKEATNGNHSTNGFSNYNKNVSHFNWALQAGFWTWQSSSNGNLFSPSIGLSIAINKTSFIIQGGVTPWHSTSSLGNRSESFVYGGVKHMTSDLLGLTFGVFRGWEFFTETDNWSFKTTGIASGIVLKHGIVEFNPAVTYTNVATLSPDSEWRLGMTLGFNVNINEAF